MDTSMASSVRRALVGQWRLEFQRHWIRNYSSSIENRNLHKRAVAALGKKSPPTSNSTKQSERKEPTLKSVAKVASPLDDKNKISKDSKESILDSEVGTKVEEPINTNFRTSVTTAAALREFAPRIVVVGVGGAGCNAVNNMIARQLSGTYFGAFF